jgi:hypothetical protein
MMDFAEAQGDFRIVEETATDGQVPVPTTEPKASEYANRAQYIVACNRWKASRAR